MLNIDVKKAIYAGCPDFLHPVLNRVGASEVGYRLARGMFWSMAGLVISRFMMIAAFVLVARMLGKTGFGELGIVRMTVGMFGVFAGYGVGLTATKYVAEFCRSDPDRAGRIIVLSGLFALLTGSLMALVLFIFAPWLAEHIINAPHLTGVLRVGTLILFFNALNGMQTGALAGFEAFKTIAHVNFFVGLLSFPILVCGAYFGGLTGAVWALAVNLGFNWLLHHLALRKEVRRYRIACTFRECSRELPIIWSFSLPAALGGVMIEPVVWACSAMLVNRTGGYAEMGLFTATLMFFQLMVFAGAILNAPLLSMISSAGPNVCDKLLGTVNIISSWFLGVMAAIPLLCFNEIIRVLFGADFDTHNFTVTFSIVVFYTTIMMFDAGLTRVLIANSLVWWMLFSNTIWAIFLISSAAFLVRWGALGLAASFTIAYTLNAVILLPLLYSRKLVPKGTLLSVKSVFIWFVIGGLVFLNIANVSLLFRSLAFVPSMLIVVIAFTKIAKDATAAKE